MVVTFTPPAVPALPPPMNIRMSVVNRASWSIAPMSITLNPAVRAITEVTNAASSAVPGGWPWSVAGLFASSSR